MVKLKIYDKRTGKIFYKEFQTEFDRDKYIRKSKYFKNLIVLPDREEESQLR